MRNRMWLLLVVVTLTAVPAFGQRFYLDEAVGDGAWSGSSSYDNGQYMDNPCTAVQDWVWVNYSAYVDGAQKAAGVDQYLFSEGTTMGGGYTASGSSLSDVEYSAPVSLRQYHKVNTPDQFHVVTVVNFDPAARNTWLTVETACGDGSPGSPQ